MKLSHHVRDFAVFQQDWIAVVHSAARDRLRPPKPTTNLTVVARRDRISPLEKVAVAAQLAEAQRGLHVAEGQAVRRLLEGMQPVRELWFAGESHPALAGREALCRVERRDGKRPETPGPACRSLGAECLSEVLDYRDSLLDDRSCVGHNAKGMDDDDGLCT